MDNQGSSTPVPPTTFTTADDLFDYLDRETAKGAIDFSFRVTDKDSKGLSFYIHPQGRSSGSGDTLFW